MSAKDKADSAKGAPIHSLWLAPRAPSSRGELMAKAASEGALAELEDLMEACDEQDIRRALICAAEHGRGPCLALLGPKATLGDINAALQQAVRHDQQEMVDAIVELAGGRRIDPFALQIAALCGHDKCIAKLVGVCDPKDDDCRALLWALERNHPRSVKMLLPLSDIEASSSGGGVSAKAFSEKGVPTASKAAVLAFIIEQGMHSHGFSAKAGGKPRL